MSHQQVSASSSYSLVGYLLAATTALSWSVLAIALKYSLSFASSSTLVWTRMGVAATLLPVLMLLLKKSPLETIKQGNSALMFFGGLALAGNYYGFMKCIELTSASNAQVMIQLAPMMLALVGIFYFKEKPSAMQLLGMLVAVFGFGLFYWEQIQQSVENVDQYMRGNIWVIFSALTWVFFTFVQKLSSKRVRPQDYNILVFAIGAVALFPLANLNEVFDASFVEMLILVALGTNTVIAYGALGEALKRIPASHVCLIIICNPLVTLFLIELMSRWQLDWISPEPISRNGYLGALFVVSGVALAIVRKTR